MSFKNNPHRVSIQEISNVSCFVSIQENLDRVLARSRARSAQFVIISLATFNGIPTESDTELENLQSNSHYECVQRTGIIMLR